MGKASRRRRGGEGSTSTPPAPRPVPGPPASSARTRAAGVVETLDAGLVVQRLQRVHRTRERLEVEQLQLVVRARALGLSWDTISTAMGVGAPSGETLRRRYDDVAPLRSPGVAPA